VGTAVRAVPNVRVSASTPWDAVVQGYLGLSDRRVAAGLRTARPGKLPRTARIGRGAGVGRLPEKGGAEFLPGRWSKGVWERARCAPRYEAFFR